MSLVTPPGRPVAQVLARVRVARSSSLVTPLGMSLGMPLACVASAVCGPDSPPARPARVARLPGPGSSRGFPVVRAIAAGSPPCSPVGTPASRNGAGVCAGAHRERRTGCNVRTCAARRGSCAAPFPVATRPTTFSLPTPLPGSRGEENPPDRRRPFFGKVGRKPSEEDVSFKPPENGEFQTAADNGRCVRAGSRGCSR